MSLRVRKYKKINHAPVIKRSSSNIFNFDHEKFLNSTKKNFNETENCSLLTENQKISTKDTNIFHKNAICVLFLEDSNGNKEEFGIKISQTG